MHAKLNSVTFKTTLGEYLSPTCNNKIIIVVMNYGNNWKIFLCNGLVCMVEWQQCCEESSANGIYLGIKSIVKGFRTGSVIAVIVPWWHHTLN